MTRFIIVKKDKVFSFIIALLISFVFISSYYFFITQNNAIETLTLINQKNTIEFDFDGDGENDKLEIVKENNNYILKIECKGETYTLTTSENSILLGDSISKWPIKLNFLDISRDNIPEIIIQLSKENHPVNYIFTWDNSKFTNVFSSTDNIVGVLNSNNNKSPELLSLSSSKGDDSIKSFILSGNTLKDITFSKLKVPGLSVIQSFIDVIEAPYELSELPNIFTPTININDLPILWGLAKDKIRYSFQNGYFTDFKWDSNGNVTGITWSISFEANQNSETSLPAKELLFSLKVEDDGYGSLKISSIKKL